MKNNDDNGQEELFPKKGEAHARWSDPDTSHEAAEEMSGDRATQLENLVAVTLKSHPGGLTTHDIVEITGLEWNSISPRMRPLVRKGFVADSGERRVAKMGRKCIVWKHL